MSQWNVFHLEMSVASHRCGDEISHVSTLSTKARIPYLPALRPLINLGVRGEGEDDEWMERDFFVTYGPFTAIEHGLEFPLFLIGRPSSCRMRNQRNSEQGGKSPVEAWQ